MNSSHSDLRIVLIGKTGNGKSSLGNSLLHSRTAFHATQSPKSITKSCEAKTVNCTDINGIQKILTVVDTPGFSDTDPTMTNQIVQNTIASQIFNMTSPGVHAFLIVLRVDRFTPEEKNTVDFIKTIFGAGAVQYCILIFTREDQLEDGQTIDDFISASDELKELVQLCGNRKFTINNKLSGQLLETKTKRLMQMIDQMVQSNSGKYYTNAEYQRIEQQRKEEQAIREEEERNKKKAYEEALVAKAREEERQRAEKREREAREEERKKAEKRVRDAREEERQRAEKRERDAKEEERKKADKREKDAREEERRRADQREQQARDEERRKAERREQEERERRKLEEELRIANIRSQERERSSACSQRNYNNDCELAFDGMRQMMLGSNMPSSSPSMGTSYQQPRLTNSASGRGGGSRFTGDYMATTGRANGQPIFEGSRGGQFYVNANGNKSYIRK